MKKTICAILAAATLGMGLVGCQKQTVSEYKTVDSKTCNFTIGMPEGWKVDRTDGMVLMYNPEDISKANVTAFSEFLGSGEEPGSVEYWETYKKQLSDNFGKITDEKVKEEDFKGLKAAHAYYNTKIGKDTFKCETLLFIYGGEVYTLTLTQGAKTDENADSYNDHSDEFAGIIKTFTPK